MTTKEQERKALAKIREIVDGLGENSYIGIAFEGCFEDAEENIENDFGLSMKQRAESAEEKLEAIYIIRKNLEKEIGDLKAKIEDLLDTNNKLSAQAEESEKHAAENRKYGIAHWNKFREQEDRADALEQEVIKLKAELYDYMVKEAKR